MTPGERSSSRSKGLEILDQIPPLSFRQAFVADDFETICQRVREFVTGVGVARNRRIQFECTGRAGWFFEHIADFFRIELPVA